jgi:exopolysaccharide biosynthesis predicted pyruvyltransferase EpsI
MTNISTPTIIKEALHQSLEQGLKGVEACALLDYPLYPNIGSHLLWISEVLYLTNILKAEIKYADSIRHFSGESMEKKIGKAPIILRSGYLGDFWGYKGDERRIFYERIVSRYRDRQIFIMPQSFSFSDPEKLKAMADNFNSHPHLTIFVREDPSYKLAKEYFHNCQIIKAPDMAFHLADMPGLPLKIKPKSSILYLCRKDFELNADFSSAAFNIPNLVVKDWVSYTWINKIPNQRIYLPGLGFLLREVWQRGLAHPGEWLSRQKWRFLHPYLNILSTIYRPVMHLNSWSMAHSGIFQLQHHRFVITNRLHGHILCLILGIPHILIPGPYNKMESFYRTWTHQIPFCQYISKAGEIKCAVEKLLESFPFAN